MRLLLTVAVIFAVSCSMFRSEPKDDPDFDRWEQLRSHHRIWLQTLHTMRDESTTWPVNDCDAWIWTGKAVAAGAMDINLALSQYPGEPGRYGRRPPINGRWCWQDDRSEGSASTWSADMFKCGMLPYALITGNRTMLEWHQAYGRDNGWKMGEPASSDRVFYRPNIRGWLARAIDHLGGDGGDDAKIPDVFLAGLDDYQAHLQICGIWADGFMRGDLSKAQLNRIEEHYERSNGSVYYHYMFGRWISGDIDPVVDALLADPPVAGDYVRCADSEPACQLSEKAFVAYLILRDGDGL